MDTAKYYFNTFSKKYDDLRRLLVYPTLVMFFAFHFATQLTWADGGLYVKIITVLAPVYYFIRFNFAAEIVTANWKNKAFLVVAYLVLRWAFLASGRDRSLMDMLMLCVLVRDIDFENILKTIFATKALCFLATIAFYLTGKLEHIVFNEYGRVRRLFGFQHPNTTGEMLFVLLLAFWWLYLRDKKIIATLIMAICFAFTFFVVDTRTTALLALIFIALIWSEKLLAKFEKYSFVLTFVPMAFFTLSFLMTIFWPQIYKIVGHGSNMLSRFSSPYDGIVQYGIHFGGQVFPPSSESWIFLDNAYTCVLLRHGIIVCVMFMSALTFVAYKLQDKKQYGLYLMFFLILVHGMMEASIYSLNINYMMLAAMAFVSTKKDKYSYMK